MKKQLLYCFFTFMVLTISATAQVGYTCTNAIQISSVPYQTIDNTANYGDIIDVSQGVSCGDYPLGTNYLAGNEVFYNYAADFTGYLNILMEPIGAESTNSAVFVYQDCANVGAACAGGMANSTTNARELNVLVFSGQSYKILISSSAATQTVAYKLTLEKNECSPKPSNLAAPTLFPNSATLSWENPGNYSSWQIEIQPAGSAIPLVAGESTTTNVYTKSGLTANTAYQFWVRGACASGNNTFSQWAGPFLFTTPICSASNKCNFSFTLSTTGNNGWDGASMQVKQNGSVISTIGTGFTSGNLSQVAVQLCKNTPFEVVWNNAGISPDQLGLTIKNSFGQTLFVKQVTDLPETIIYSESAVSCATSLCSVAPYNLTTSQLSSTSATVNWVSPTAESWDIYVTSITGSVPNAATVPTYAAVQKPFTITDLTQNSSYKVFVRSNCNAYIQSGWSAASTLNLVTTCYQPYIGVASEITTTSAKVSWGNVTGNDVSWEILVQPIDTPTVPSTVPSYNPVLENGAFIVPLTTTDNFALLSNLTIATNYVCYVRNVCNANDKSDWSNPLLFNTKVCGEENKCTYKFLKTNLLGENWNSGVIKIIQNGVVVATLSGAANNPNGSLVGLCSNVPFSLYWSNGGTMPQNIGLTVINPFNDIIYTKEPGQGTPLTTLFTSDVNCTPPSCSKPTNLLVSNVTQSSAQLSWTETGTAAQWEVYVAPEESAIPVNGTPLMTGVANYFIANSNTNFPITSLTLATKYVFYVRPICSTTEIGNWNILSPKSFITKAINDECAASISVPVNPTPEMVQTVAGSTLGGTASAELANCPGIENDDVWFSFVATNTYHIIKLLNVTGSTTSVRFSVLAGTECGSLTPLFCSAANSNTGLLNNLIIGSTYKIRVYTNGSNINEFTSFDLGIATPGIMNDECSTAINIPISDSFENITYVPGTLTGATASPQTSTCPGSEDDDVWFQFTANSTHLRILLSNIVGTSPDLRFSLYEGIDCGNLTLLSCYVTPTAVAQNLIIGQEYKIRIWSNSSTLEDITFDVSINFLYPPLAASTSLFTVDQLVTNVLVNNPCVAISNITSGTGTTTATNGIGYFTNVNPMFPISSGIILSTGNAANVGGANTTTLSDGGASGDSDLEDIILAATGTTINSYNATKLEFDFISQNEFMSFNFVFASEEYGAFQCQYADAFAFLLTDLTTGITTNLALVPGTTTPISVVTIRNMLYNSACASVNEGFFGTYNLGEIAPYVPINFNGQTTLMSASSPIIANNPYHIKMVIADRQDTIYDSAVFIQAGSFSSGPPACSDKLQLEAFIDTNNNGIKESTESSFSYGSFVYQLNDAGALNNISSPIGVYTIYDGNPLNSYDFTYAIHPEYASYFANGVTTHSNITIPIGSGTQTLYFPIAQTQSYNDVTVSVSPIGQPVAGFSYTNKIVYTNLGTATTSGTINYTKDTNVTISSTENGVVVTPTGFSYTFANLAPYETRSFNVKMNVPSIPVVNIDDVLTSSVQISAPANDINPNNNSFEMVQIVVASYDPNDKMEAHGDKLDINTFNQDDYLFYTIRFQNTGTANAISIRVEDLLDAQLDEASVRMVSASHNYVMERVGNKLIWNFDYIYLPSQLENEELSQGYITFKVKVKPGFEVGDIIPNFAEIYFDTNPAIITNTFLSEFEINLGTKAFTTNNILLYPNPTNSILHVSLQDTNESLAKIVIYDVIGKAIDTISGNNAQQTAINVGNLATGVYMIEITTENNLKQIQKFIVN